MKPAIESAGNQARDANLKNFSHSIAHLDVAALAGVAGIAVGAVLVRRRVNARRSQVVVGLASLAQLGVLRT